MPYPERGLPGPFELLGLGRRKCKMAMVHSSTMSLSPLAVREIDEVEVGFYLEHGWCSLPGLVDPEVCTQLRAILQKGLTYDKFSGAVDAAFGEIFGLVDESALARELILSPTMGHNVSRLLHGKPVRLQLSSILVKEPAAAPGGHGPTAFHQDFPYFPMDRSQMVTIWLALEPVTPAMGPMRFVDRSHEAGVLCRSFLSPNDDAISQHPWLGELEAVGPTALQPGDATAHSCLTVHGAAANLGDRARVAVKAMYFAADTLFTGAPFPQTDGLGLFVNAPFDHPKFPQVPCSVDGRI